MPGISSWQGSYCLPWKVFITQTKDLAVIGSTSDAWEVSISRIGAPSLVTIWWTLLWAAILSEQANQQLAHLAEETDIDFLADSIADWTR